MTAAVFLAGIVMPSSLRYADLFRAIGGSETLIAHELVIYTAHPSVPRDYSIDQEVQVLDEATRSAGHDVFHLYGHSAGGAIALAYADAHPDRVLSLALDEPSTDFSDKDLTSDYWLRVRCLRELPTEAQIPAFRVLQVQPGFAPPPVREPRPSWMEGGPARIAAFSDAAVRHRLPEPRFNGPVLFSYGSRTHPRYEGIRDSLARRFASFAVERYEGLHHLESGHQARAELVAATLRRLWASTSAQPGGPTR